MADWGRDERVIVWLLPWKRWLPEAVEVITVLAGRDTDTNCCPFPFPPAFTWNKLKFLKVC